MKVKRRTKCLNRYEEGDRQTEWQGDRDRDSMTQTCDHLIRHGDTFTVDEGENLVVVHHRVHALNPQGVHRPVKHNPFLLWFLI